MREDYLGGDAHNLSPADREVEKTLRPINFDDFTGQFKVVDNIKIFVQAAKKNEERLWITFYYTARPDWVKQPCHTLLPMNSIPILR